MTNSETIEKLCEMRLNGMADEFRSQISGSLLKELSFEERFGIMVDLEWSHRRNNKIKRLIHNAEFYFSTASVEDIDYNPDRKLDKHNITVFASCEYITEAHNIIILGATGAGKTYVSNALGVAACRRFYSTKYIRLPDLLNEFAVARGEGNIREVMKKYKKVKLLILDDWLLIPLTESESRDLLEIIEARHKYTSTIFCSQFDSKGWCERIGEDTLAEAVLDRIVYDSYTLVIHGEESMRKRKGII